jgi:hypothetical protein
MANGPQMRNKPARSLCSIVTGTSRRDRDDGLVAGLPAYPVGTFGRHPIARDGEGSQGSRGRDHEVVAQGGFQIATSQNRFANGAIITKALDHAPRGADGNGGIVIAAEDDNGVVMSYFCESGGDGSMDGGSRRHGDLSRGIADRNRIHKIRISEQRRGEEHGDGHGGLIVRQGGDHMARRIK